MAQKVIVSVTDDMDGTPDAKPVQFALGKNLFELDLSSANELKLHQALAPFINAARTASAEYRRQMTTAGSNGTGTRNGTTVPQARPQRTPKDRERAGRIREWAKTQPDIPHVSERGRIPRDVVQKFEEYEALRDSL